MRYETKYIKDIVKFENLGGHDLTIPISRSSEIIPHFTKDEMLHLLSMIKAGRTGMIFQFLWRTGARVSECIGVKKRDLDFDNNEITIKWLKSRKLQFRVIPMHHTLKHPLHLFTAGQKAEEKIFPISRQRVDQLCKKHHFDHAHKFRHSYAINFLRQSKDPMALMILKDLLGHSRINTTMQYLKVVPISMKKAIEEISFD